MPRAIPCTSSDDPERVASEPLLLQEYVHGNCGGCMNKPILKREW